MQRVLLEGWWKWSCCCEMIFIFQNFILKKVLRLRYLLQMKTISLLSAIPRSGSWTLTLFRLLFVVLIIVIWWMIPLPTVLGVAARFEMLFRFCPFMRWLSGRRIFHPMITVVRWFCIFWPALRCLFRWISSRRTWLWLFFCISSSIVGCGVTSVPVRWTFVWVWLMVSTFRWIVSAIVSLVIGRRTITSLTVSLRCFACTFGTFGLFHFQIIQSFLVFLLLFVFFVFSVIWKKKLIFNLKKNHKNLARIFKLLKTFPYCAYSALDTGWTINSLNQFFVPPSANFMSKRPAWSSRLSIWK